MEYKYENGRIIPINNSISNKRLDRLEEVVKTLSPEGDVLTKEDIAAVATTANNALKEASTANTNLNDFKNSVEGTYVKETALNNYATKEKVKQMTETTASITPNILHVWGEVAKLNITLADGEDGVVNEYMIQFTSGATATTLELPDNIQWMATPIIQANKTYQLSIVNNLGIIGEWS